MKTAKLHKDIEQNYIRAMEAFVRSEVEDICDHAFESKTPSVMIGDNAVDHFEIIKTGASVEDVVKKFINEFILNLDVIYPMVNCVIWRIRPEINSQDIFMDKVYKIYARLSLGILKPGMTVRDCHAS